MSGVAIPPLVTFVCAWSLPSCFASTWVMDANSVLCSCPSAQLDSWTQITLRFAVYLKPGSLQSGFLQSLDDHTFNYIPSCIEDLLHFETHCLFKQQLTIIGSETCLNRSSQIRLMQLRIIFDLSTYLFSWWTVCLTKWPPQWKSGEDDDFKRHVFVRAKVQNSETLSLKESENQRMFTHEKLEMRKWTEQIIKTVASSFSVDFSIL